MIVRYTAEAFLDLEDGIDFYAMRSVDLAADFLSAVVEAVDEAANNPQRYPLYEAESDAGGLRRYWVRRFPYFVAYRIVGESIEIVAIAHSSREPSYWKKEKK